MRSRTSILPVSPYRDDAASIATRCFARRKSISSLSPSKRQCSESNGKVRLHRGQRFLRSSTVRFDFRPSHDWRMCRALGVRGCSACSAGTTSIARSSSSVTRSQLSLRSRCSYSIGSSSSGLCLSRIASIWAGRRYRLAVQRQNLIAAAQADVIQRAVDERLLVEHDVPASAS